jgi:hypothetical protein
MRFFLLSALFISLLQAQDSSTLEGTVVDSATGLGIGDVAVYFGSDHGPSYDTVTDSNGRFRINSVKDGQYGSHFEKPGYIAQFSGTNDSVLKPVRVVSGQDTRDLRFTLIPYGALAGRVVDTEGKPAPGAAVTLGARAEKTDPEGRFLFKDLLPGQYTLEARASDTHGFVDG